MKIPILRIPFSDSDISFIQNRLNGILQSGQLAMGKNVTEFEDRFSEFTGVNFAVGVNSGTSALEMILRAIDIRNSTVIVPTNTFMATATAVVHAGGKIIFCDVVKEDLCIDPSDLRKKIQKNTKAVILVHIGGIISTHLKEIEEICESSNLFLIEDAAHAHGSTINQRKAGSIGVAGAFSFYPTKVMTCGEGGMVTTNDKPLYKKLLILRDHGKPDHRYNIHTEFGYNWRLSEIHAVIGVEQMNKINWILDQRRSIAKKYEERLKGFNDIGMIPIPRYIKSSYYKFICYLPDGISRDNVKRKMQADYHIELTGEVYANPCHLQPVFKKYPNILQNSEDYEYPGSRFVCDRQICLPLYPGLSDEEIKYVAESLKMTISSLNQ